MRATAGGPAAVTEPKLGDDAWLADDEAWLDDARLLLTIDSSAGLTVGVLTLLLAPFLTTFYAWPPGFAVLMGAVNLAYGLYSGSLRLRLGRTGRVGWAPLVLLVVANSAWVGHCLTQVFYLRASASFFGLAHLAGEALFVGGLAFVEARRLLIATDRESRGSRGVARLEAMPGDD